MDCSGVMMPLKFSKVACVSLAAVLTTGCFGKAGPDAFFAGAVLTTAFMAAASAHTDQERQEAWEREHDRDEAAGYPHVVVVYDHDGVGAPALPPPAPLPPPPVPFDAKAARNALADVELDACRAAGAPRGYGHAKATINPSGDISKVIIDEPAGMPVAAAKCIGDAIGRVTVPEFTGSFVTVGTTYFVP
jgi:hypothetical protein